MIRRMTAAVAAVLGLGLTAHDAAAAGPQGPYVTGNLGVAFTQDADNVGAAGGVGINVKSEYDAGYFVSGAAGYRWMNGGALEGEVLYSKADVDKLTVTSAGGTGVSLGLPAASGNVSTLGFMVNGAYHHDTGTPWTPFLMAGLGVAKVSINDVKVAGVLLADDSDTVFAYQAGAGVDYAVTQRFSVGLGYRYFATADPSLTDAAGGSFDSELSQHVITVRGTFQF